MRKLVGVLTLALAVAACGDSFTMPFPDGPSFSHGVLSNFELEVVEGPKLSASWTASSIGTAQTISFYACTTADPTSCAAVPFQTVANVDPGTGSPVVSEMVDPGFYRAGFRSQDGSSNDNSGFSDIVQVGDDTTWFFSGFYRPVNMDVMNGVRRGSTVPLKFNVFEDEDHLEEITDVATLEAKFTVAGISCDGEAEPVDDEDFGTAGSTVLRYDEVAGQFIQNWKVPRVPGCYELTLETAGGSISAEFEVR